MSSRAEEAALKAYPVRTYRKDQGEPEYSSDYNANDRYRFQEGYEQAEKDLTFVAQFSSGPDGFYYGKGYEQARKDLALTWEDIERIEHYCEQVNREHNMGTFRGTPYGKSFYKEVARRFNKAKEEKKWDDL